MPGSEGEALQVSSQTEGTWGVGSLWDAGVSTGGLYKSMGHQGPPIRGSSKRRLESVYLCGCVCQHVNTSEHQAREVSKQAGC